MDIATAGSGTLVVVVVILTVGIVDVEVVDDVVVVGCSVSIGGTVVDVVVEEVVVGGAVVVVGASVVVVVVAMVVVVDVVVGARVVVATATPLARAYTDARAIVRSTFAAQIHKVTLRSSSEYPDPAPIPIPGYRQTPSQFWSAAIALPSKLCGDGGASATMAHRRAMPAWPISLP
jgi:hypothetical protein